MTNDTKRTKFFALRLLKLSAATVLLSLIVGTVAAFVRPYEIRDHTPKMPPAQYAAYQAMCSDIADRGEAEGLGGISIFLFTGCELVLRDTVQNSSGPAMAQHHARLFLETLQQWDGLTKNLVSSRREAGADEAEPSQSGKFLMARHLGVIFHFEMWKRYRFADQQNGQS